MADRSLIVNSDDFGISPGVNRGVLEAHRGGIVTSASLMSNQPWAPQAVALWRDAPDLGLGLHLTLTSGAPCSPPSRVPSLVGADGRFHGLASWLARAQAGALRADELRREITTQVELALALGATLGHLDSHHHVHTDPRVGQALISVARQYRISAVRCPSESPRWTNPRDLGRAALVSLRAFWLRAALRRAGLRTSDRFAGMALGYGFNVARLEAALSRLKPGLTELMTHPGYPDLELARATRFVAGREHELASLLDPRARAVLDEQSIDLVRW